MKPYDMGLTKQIQAVGKKLAQHKHILVIMLIGSSLVIGRAGQARAINVSQEVHGVHDLGMVVLFRAYLLINVWIGGSLGLRNHEHSAHGENDKKKEASGLEHQKVSCGIFSGG